MNRKKYIETGDKVNVYFEHADAELYVTITYRPVATGDCWYAEREDGTIVAIQTFAKMEQVNDD